MLIRCRCRLVPYGEKASAGSETGETKGRLLAARLREECHRAEIAQCVIERRAAANNEMLG